MAREQTHGWVIEGSEGGFLGIYNWDRELLLEQAGVHATRAEARLMESKYPGDTIRKVHTEDGVAIAVVPKLK